MERIEKLKELLKEDPSDNFLQHALALEYVKIGDEDKARKLFERILERDPSYIGSYYPWQNYLSKWVIKNQRLDGMSRE